MAAAFDPLSRRNALQALVVLGVAPTLGCQPKSEDGLYPELDLPWDDDLDLVDTVASERREVESLLDAILPAEFDAQGSLTSVGAVEVGAFDVLRIRRFVPLAQARGLLPRLLGVELDDSSAADQTLLTLLASDLSFAASRKAVGSLFSDLNPQTQAELLDEAFADPRRRGLYLAARAGALVAFLGAIYSDEGLVEVGFPPFMSLRSGAANHGYPRDSRGEPVFGTDVQRLSAAGTLDHYSYDRRPEGMDDLSDLLSRSGDLL